MELLLPLIGIALPILVAVGAALVVVTIAVFAINRPWLLMLPFIAALFWLTDSRYGRIDEVGSSLLGRGSGVLYFALFLWLMLLSLIWMHVGRLFRPTRQLATSVAVLPWFAAWGALLLGHVAAAVAADIPIRQALSPAGFSFIVWMGVLVAAMVSAVERPADAHRFAWFIVALGLGRAMFGLVRFVAYGGDPANAYANRHGLELKLTFFDINDSLVCALTIAIALVMIYRREPARPLSQWQLGFLWAAVLIPALCIVLSFRRTAWVGLTLALAFVAMQLPARPRVRLFMLAIPSTLLGIAYASYKRLSQVTGPSEGFLYDLMPRSVGPDSMRLLELKLAFQTFVDQPVFGVGAWGGYKGWQAISWQHEWGEGGGGTFLHSGLLHVALKTGLVGLCLLAGTAMAFYFTWRRLRRSLPNQAMPLAVAGVAGVLFMVPDMLIGTPVPQVRTMMMIALCISLPFVAERAFAAHGLRGTVPAQGHRAKSPKFSQGLARGTVAASR
jgi:hypothetical protein